MSPSFKACFSGMLTHHVGELKKNPLENQDPGSHQQLATSLLLPFTNKPKSRTKLSMNPSGLTQLTWLPLDPSDIVFDAFYHVNSLEYYHPLQRVKSEFLGLFEDNDRKKRLMMVVNYSTDISDFWEFSATGFRPIEESNEAYKLGVNYIMYGITH